MVGKGYERSVKKVEEVQAEKKGRLSLGISWTGIGLWSQKRWGEGGRWVKEQGKAQNLDELKYEGSKLGQELVG